MKRKASKGLAAAGRTSSAANEEFAAPADGVDSLEEHPQPAESVRGVAHARQRIPRILQRAAEQQPDPFH